MKNLFTFASNDQSLSYLNSIFGSMNGIIPNPGGQPGGAVTLLGTMFKTFNSVILVVGIAIIIYVTVVGVLMTAHEGEFMGKSKWSSLWVPIRMVLGIMALIPSSIGYSGLQLLMMWVIVQGVGAADTLFNTGLGFLTVMGSPAAQITIPSVGANQALGDLFRGLVCEATTRESRKDYSGLPTGGYYCNSSGDNWCSSTNAFNPNATSFTMGPQGQCGTLTYCNPGTNTADPTALCTNAASLSCLACKAQISALAAIVPTLAAIAQQFQNADYTYRQFFYQSGTVKENSSWQWIYSFCSAQNPAIPQNKCCIPSGSSTVCQVPPQGNTNNQGTSGTTGSSTPTVGSSGNSSFPSPNNNGNPQNPDNTAVTNLYWPFALAPSLGAGNFINTAVSDYIYSISGPVTTYLAQQGDNPASFSAALSTAAATGWILAGGYYYAMSQLNKSNLTGAMPPLTMNVQNPAQNNLNNFRNNFSAAQVLTTAAAASSAGGGAGGSAFSLPSQLSQLQGPVDSTASSVNQLFTVTTSNPAGTNPLSQVQMAGHILIIIVEVAFAALLIMTIALGFAGNIDVFVIGTGAMDPLGPITTLAYMVLLPAVYALMAIMVSFGALLGIYTPLIPYIVFTFGAIAWLISTVEAMVAGPLVALGILSPSGEHEILGKAAPALMLLFNVFLRPSLMIFGLMAAMLLAGVVVYMINYLFWSTVVQAIGSFQGTAGGSAYADPLEMCIFLAAYVTLIVAALNKCFAAIYIIPERVMLWISGQAGVAGGEAEALGEAKAGVSGAAGGAGSGMETARGGTETGAGKERSAKLALKKAKLGPKPKQ
jgi:hypothetical protein